MRRGADLRCEASYCTPVMGTDGMPGCEKGFETKGVGKWECGTLRNEPSSPAHRSVPPSHIPTPLPSVAGPGEVVPPQVEHPLVERQHPAPRHPIRWRGQVGEPIIDPSPIIRIHSKQQVPQSECVSTLAAASAELTTPDSRLPSSMASRAWTSTGEASSRRGTPGPNPFLIDATAPAGTIASLPPAASSTCP